MHEANKEFWRRTKALYPEFFSNRNVIELGSMNICGTVRDFFDDCKYTGVDWREGAGVDVVSLVHDLNLGQRFDVVISASMLEHDPYWKLSLDKMVELLAPHGILLLSWGAAENVTHHEGTAPDGKFHSLPAGLVLRHLEERDIYVHQFVYEETLLDGAGADAGCVALVAFKDPMLARGSRSVAELKASDK